MICPNCNHPNPDEATVCEGCSASLATAPVKEKKKLKIKTIIVAAAAVVAVCIITFLILLFTVKSRVEGAWISDVNYLDYYSTNCKYAIAFTDDGEYTGLLTSTNGDILNFKESSWSVSGFTIRVDNGDSTTIYEFNPFTGTIKSGVWTYKKS